MTSPPISPTTTTSSPPLLTTTTFLSLLLTLILLLLAHLLSQRLLPPSTPRKLRLLYIWHVFDFLIHLLLEGSFLYHCFFTYIVLPSFSHPAVSSGSDYPHPASLGVGGVGGNNGAGITQVFLGHANRRYGSAYGTGPLAKLWQEYARADRRWGGADVGVVGVEMVTVGVGAPVALWVAEMIRRGAGGEGMAKGGRGGASTGRGRKNAQLWFWASVLATGELYGGWMTFAPEWLSGCANLETGNWMFLWVYLVFFNTLWVWFPLWVLYEAYSNIAGAFEMVEGMGEGPKKKE